MVIAPRYVPPPTSLRQRSRLRLLGRFVDAQVVRILLIVGACPLWLRFSTPAAEMARVINASERLRAGYLERVQRARELIVTNSSVARANG